MGTQALALLLQLLQLMLVFGSHGYSPATYKKPAAAIAAPWAALEPLRAMRFSLGERGRLAVTSFLQHADGSTSMCCRHNPILFVFPAESGTRSFAAPRAWQSERAVSLTLLRPPQLTATRKRRNGCSILRATAAASPMPGRTPATTKDKTDVASSPSSESGLPVNAREAALRYQQQQVAELLSGSPESTDAAPSGKELATQFGAAICTVLHILSASTTLPYVECSFCRHERRGFLPNGGDFRGSIASCSCNKTLELAQAKPDITLGIAAAPQMDGSI